MKHFQQITIPDHVSFVEYGRYSSWGIWAPVVHLNDDDGKGDFTSYHGPTGAIEHRH